jgi:hypothetical protein
MPSKYGIQDTICFVTFKAGFRLKSVPSRYCGMERHCESEDHGWDIVSGDGSSVRGSKAVRGRSYSAVHT